MRVLRVMALDVLVAVATVGVAVTSPFWLPPVLLAETVRRWWLSAKDRAQ